MSVLTINAFPLTATITATYNEETITGIGQVVIEANDSTVVSYTVEAQQCTSKSGTFTISGDMTEAVALNYIGSISVDTWVPSTGRDTFPTHIAMLGKGGWRSVESNDERDAIPSARREAGMSVYVTSDEKLYILNEDLTTWTEFQPGSLKGGWKEVETVEERDAIPDDLLEVGMMVYVTSEAKGYILTSLNTEVTPTLKSWEEYKPGQGDYIRKITTYPISSVAPLIDGEIIQYQGPTVPPYWNGYFYKDAQEYTYISSKSSDMGPASIKVINENSLRNYVYRNQSVISGGWSDLKLVFSSTYAATVYATNGETEVQLNGFNSQEDFENVGLRVSSSAGYPVSGSVAYIAPAHFWKQVDVQPVTDLVWGNIEGDITNQTDLQEALDSKLDKSSETEKVYGTDTNGNQVVYSAGENIEFYNKLPQVFPGAGDISYTEVGSLKAEDGQYIDTGLNYHNEVKGPTYDITFRYINLAGDYANGAIFAGRGVEGRWGIGIDSYSRELRIIHGGGSIYNRTGITADTNWHRVYSTYDANVDGGTTYYYYDDELIFQTTKAFKTDATNTNMTIFMFGAHTEFGYTSQESTVEIASFKWYDANGNVVFDYVPVVSSIGEAGFYDKATSTFKTSVSGTALETEPFNEIHKINAVIPVKDVKIADSSVVDEEGIAQLGSMAGESVEDYMTSAEIESALALKQDIIQCSEVPEASEELLGKIIQYTGETTQDYTNGYFYKCFDSHTYEDASAIFVGGDIANLTVDTDTFVNAGISVDEDHFVHYSESESSWLDENEQLVNLSDWGVSYEGFAVDGDTMNIRVNTASTTYYWTNILVQDDNGGIANGIVNQNPAEYAVNPIYDWVGTIEEYTAQNIETLHPEWMCYITNDGGLPSGGSSSGYVQSVNGETGAVVVDEFSPEDAGAEGNVLVKTATGYTWGEGGSGKTEDENGNLYISDEFAKDGDDEQYPLIYRTKSEDDSNVIKINAPVEIEEYDGVKRSLKVSGSLSASDTKVKSLTIDGTIRANGNIWMGKGKQIRQKIQTNDGVVFHREYYTGESWAWVSEDGSWQYIYSEKEIPEINDYVYVNSDLTDQYSTVTSSWEDSQWVWDSSKASIKQVKEISFHNDTNGVIDNVYKIRGQNWNIEGNGRAEFDSIHGGNWELDGDGTFRGKKIDLGSGNNRMGSLEVNGAIKVWGESTVTGTSHIRGDIKLDAKDSGNGYARIYPTENETSSLGTPNHRFEKIYVKDIDISGEGGANVDISHLDGVEEINENTLEFTRLADLAAGYYNEDGQYIGSTVTQYINSESDLPFVPVSFIGADGNTYYYSASTDYGWGPCSTWHDEVNDVYGYTRYEEVEEGTPIYLKPWLGDQITTVVSIQKEITTSAINNGWSYDGVSEDVAMITVFDSDCQGIKLRAPGRLLNDDVVYRFRTFGNGQYGQYAMYSAETAREDDWSDGVRRRWVWIYRTRCPKSGTRVSYVCDSMTDPTINALSGDMPTVNETIRQYVECIKGLTSEGGFAPSGLELIRMDSGGQLGSIWHGQYWDASQSQLVDTYAWTTDYYNPRVGDTIYKARYDSSTNAATPVKDANDEYVVIGAITHTYIPSNGVHMDYGVQSGTPGVHNYFKKYFNFYRPRLETKTNANSYALFDYGGFYNNIMNGEIVSAIATSDISSYKGYYKGELLPIMRTTYPVAFYSHSTIINGEVHHIWSLAGGRTNPIPGATSSTMWVDSKNIRNPQPGNRLYMCANNSTGVVQNDDGFRPCVSYAFRAKRHCWLYDLGGGNINKYYTFARNPRLGSYYDSPSSYSGLYYPTNNNIVSTIVPTSMSGIYYFRPTSQYMYYTNDEFKECFYHEEVQDNVYSDIKLNNFYYWRALDGSYTITDGKEHEIVSDYDNLPRPDIILTSVSGDDEYFFRHKPEYDTADAKGWAPWWEGGNSPIFYSDASININRVGNKLYSDSTLTTEVGEIAKITYSNEKVKVRNKEFNLSLDLDNNTYFIWQCEDGTEVYSRMPNPEVDDMFYTDSSLVDEYEYGTVQEIIAGEPKPGTFYELESYDAQTTSGRYFWNGSIFVEAEKLYKSITIYGEDNDLGKPRIPWNNIYVKSIESPYGTVTTRDGYLEVNGGKITNVTTINYNGADYIYTSVNVVNRLAIEDSGDMVRCEPVELTLNYCKWQSETNPEIVYYTPDTNVNGEDDLYLDKECTEQSGLVINTVFRTPTQVFSWTEPTSGNIVYSLIRQLLEDDEVYDNDLCIRRANPMLITSSQFTDIFQESIIMNNNSITLVLRDTNGDVTGSCMLNATKLNKLEQLLQNA